MSRANTDPQLIVQNLPRSAGHAGKNYTTVSTLGAGDPAFSGVQPAWEEGTSSVKPNTLLPYTSSVETQMSLKVSRVWSSLQLTRYETGLLIHLVIQKVFPLLYVHHHRCHGFNLHFRATEVNTVKNLFGNTLTTSSECNLLNPNSYWGRNLKAPSVLPMPVIMLKICLFSNIISSVPRCQWRPMSLQFQMTTL